MFAQRKALENSEKASRNLFPTQQSLRPAL